MLFRLAIRSVGTRFTVRRYPTFLLYAAPAGLCRPTHPKVTVRSAAPLPTQTSAVTVDRKKEEAGTKRVPPLLPLTFRLRGLVFFDHVIPFFLTFFTLKALSLG